MRNWNEPRSRVAAPDHERDSQIAFMQIVRAAGPAHQDLRRVALLHEFGGPQNPMPVRIAGQHHDDVCVRRRFRMHEERAHPAQPEGMSQKEKQAQSCEQHEGE